MTYTLTQPHIELYKLIKILDLVDSGAQAKALIEAGLVHRNGQIEYRKRAKILRHEQIRIGDVIIHVD